MKKVVAGANEQGMRLDRFLRKYLCGAPLGYIYRAVRRDVRVNGKRLKEGYILRQGDEISIYIPDAELEELTLKKARSHGQGRPDVVYEDDSVLIVNKPAGLLTHGDAAEKKDTLVNRVTDYLIEKGDYDPRGEKTFSPSPSNRLDRNTSGLVVFGKNGESRRALNEAFRDRKGISKFYLALVKGEIREEMDINGALIKDAEKNRVSLSQEGRSSRTVVRPLQPGKSFSLVEAELLTGRPHQIRVHLASTGHPLIGDPKYGDRTLNRELGAERQMLHAWKLVFTAAAGPLDRLRGTEITAEMPRDMKRYI